MAEIIKSTAAQIPVTESMWQDGDLWRALLARMYDEFEECLARGD